MDTSLLETPIEASIQAEISYQFWGNAYRRQLPATDINLAAFWNYYCKKSALSLHDGGRHVAVRTHQDVVDVVYLLQQGVTRTSIKQTLRSKLKMKHANEDELLENSIDLAASLVLMCDCGTSSHGFSGRIEIQWKDSSLGACLAEYFEEKSILAHEKVKLEKTFTAKNISRIAGLEIIWTDNLVDHLRLTDDDTKVHIFHHASFLEYQRHR